MQNEVRSNLRRALLRMLAHLDLLSLRYSISSRAYCFELYTLYCSAALSSLSFVGDR